MNIFYISKGKLYKVVNALICQETLEIVGINEIVMIVKFIIHNSPKTNPGCRERTYIDCVLLHKSKSIEISLFQTELEDSLEEINDNDIMLDKPN